MTKLSEKAQAVLKVELIDGALWLTKRNPEVMYGISGAMVEAFHAAINRAKNDPEVRALVFDAEGGFHGGAIVFTEFKPELALFEEADFRTAAHTGYALGEALASLPIPVITVAEKGALGGSLELMCRTDFVYCTDAAEFTLPEVTAGLIPGWGGTQWVGRLMTFRKAQELMLLGEPLKGREAEEYGLVTRSFADRETLYAHVDKVLTRLQRRCAPDAFQGAKASLAEVWAGPLAHGLAKELTASLAVKNNRTFVKALGARRAGMAFDFVADEAVPR